MKLLIRLIGRLRSARNAWRTTKLDAWNRYSWWQVHRRHHWWLKLLGKEPQRPTGHAPWLGAEAIAYRRMMAKLDRFSHVR